MNDAIASILKSRRAWALIIGVLVVVFQSKTGMTADQVQAIWQTMLAYAGIETIRSSKDGSLPILELLRSILDSKKPDPPALS